MTLPIRLFHVLAMAALVGGGALVWWVGSRTGGPDAPGGPTLAGIAWRYERLFWLAAGVAVVTGVGNLGGMAPAVPGPGTSWGATFGVKLGAILVLLVGSTARTLLVWRWRRDAGESGAGDHELGPGSAGGLGVGALYGATTLWLVGVVTLGVVIAHG